MAKGTIREITAATAGWSVSIKGKAGNEMLPVALWARVEISDHVEIHPIVSFNGTMVQGPDIPGYDGVHADDFPEIDDE